ncbi:MAG: hypothetical protein JKX72_06595 [Robiginitomaculum sp.]|nr:hypothetical protein [Robiginitomaculum sp.]
MRANVTITKIFLQDDFDSFAALSGDFNPIHVDPYYAANNRFGKTVAHGALLVTILRGLTEQLIPGGNQISHRIKFPAPTYAAQKIEFSVTIISQEKRRYRIALQVRTLKDGVVTCEGEAIIEDEKERYADRR